MILSFFHLLLFSQNERPYGYWLSLLMLNNAGCFIVLWTPATVFSALGPSSVLVDAILTHWIHSSNFYLVEREPTSAMLCCIT